MSAELIKTIFEQYHFAKLTEKSSAKKIIKNIYNAFFGKKIIESRTDKSRNVKFIISDTTRYMYEFASNRLEIRDIKLNIPVNDPFINENIIKLDTIEDDEEEEEIVIIKNQSQLRI